MALTHHLGSLLLKQTLNVLPYMKLTMARATRLGNLTYLHHHIIREDSCFWTLGTLVEVRYSNGRVRLSDNNPVRPCLLLPSNSVRRLQMRLYLAAQWARKTPLPFWVLLCTPGQVCHFYSLIGSVAQREVRGLFISLCTVRLSGPVWTRKQYRCNAITPCSVALPEVVICA